MKKQTWVFIAVVGLIIVGIVFMFSHKNSNNVSSSLPSPTTSLSAEEKLLMNTNVLVPETDGIDVQLTNGKGETTNGELTASVVMAPGIVAAYDTQNGQDIFGVFFANTGGSGEFAYLGLFYYENGKLISQDSVPLGDRIKPQKIATTDSSNPDAEYDAVIMYLTHGPNQAMAEEPNEAVTNMFPVKDHKFLVQ